MRAKNVQVPAQASQSRQTHTRVAVDIPESSRARRDEEEDDDTNDDDIHDPTYGQEELIGSQLENAPEGTQNSGACQPSERIQKFMAYMMKR
jgi:hypothetical protein